MTVIVCPGSYDPVTVGHLDVVHRAAALFDEVVVAVLVNSTKRTLFTPDERADLLRDALAAPAAGRGAGAVGPGPGPGAVPGPTGTVRVEVVTGGLLVDYCRSVGARAVVKGLRSGTDFAYELPMALMNRRLSGLETVFVPGDPAFEHISSSLVKEVAALGGDVTGMVPETVLPLLLERLRARRDG